jgi:hypothetical protein
MTMRSIGLHVLAIAAGVFLAASPAMGQSCPKQAATGHVEFIGTMPANLGRHIIYSFSAIQTGAVDENEECVVNGEVEERLYSPEGELLRHSHLTTVCIGIRALDRRSLLRLGAGSMLRRDRGIARSRSPDTMQSGHLVPRL